MKIGINHQQAPELRVPKWIGPTGAVMAPLTLADLGDGMKILFCFQDWCPGCHSRGFPTLRVLVDRLANKGVGFAAIQTAFRSNAKKESGDQTAKNQALYRLEIPFGYDPVPDGADQPTVMADYRTAGTPWFIVINPEGEVIYNDFRLNAAKFLLVWDQPDL
jgi:thiol-disulfide isomerase/thioredoxin